MLTLFTNLRHNIEQYKRESNVESIHTNPLWYVTCVPVFTSGHTVAVKEQMVVDI